MSLEPLLQILSTDLGRRTDEQVSRLVAVTKGLRFFRTLPNTLHAAVCRSITGRTLQPRELIFLEGTIGETFYIVIDGAVQILQNHAPPAAQRGGVCTVPPDAAETLVADLQSGGSFGELSILGTGSERRRAASAVAGTHGAVLGALSRDDYLRLLQDEQRRGLHECVSKLRSVRALRGMPSLSLTRVAVLMRNNRIRFARGETILAQGACPDRLYVLTSGEVVMRCACPQQSEDPPAHGRTPRSTKDLLLLICGGDGAYGAELVGESCAKRDSSQRASVASFVASSETRGYFLDVADVQRLTGNRLNKLVGGPLHDALCSQAQARADQVAQRLAAIQLQCPGYDVPVPPNTKAPAVCRASFSARQWRRTPQPPGSARQRERRRRGASADGERTNTAMFARTERSQSASAGAGRESWATWTSSCTSKEPVQRCPSLTSCKHIPSIPSWRRC